jgi:hypothetical protein
VVFVTHLIIMIGATFRENRSQLTTQPISRRNSASGMP